MTKARAWGAGRYAPPMKRQGSELVLTIVAIAVWLVLTVFALGALAQQSWAFVPPVVILSGLALWWIIKSFAPTSDTPNQKVCPDCAEKVLFDARVCKHCGYRFASP